MFDQNRLVASFKTFKHYITVYITCMLVHVVFEICHATVNSTCIDTVASESIYDDLQENKIVSIHYCRCTCFIVLLTNRLNIFTYTMLKELVIFTGT